MKSLKGFAIAALSAGSLLAACSGASATNYYTEYWSFVGINSVPEGLGTLQIEVPTGLPVAGQEYEVTSISGWVIDPTLGQIASGIPGNPNYPADSTSPSGFFYYDQGLFQLPASPQVTNPGLLFFAYGEEWNIFNNNAPDPGGDLLYSQGGATQDFGTFTATLAQTPLPSTWTMLIAGFIGLGFFAYRGSKKRGTAMAAA
jgi:hypothetical protein